MENQTHLNAIGEITEMIYAAKEEMYKHLGAIAMISEEFYFAKHAL